MLNFFFTNLHVSFCSQYLASITFRMGVNDRYNPESWSAMSSVTDMYIHEDYNPYINWANDIALFKLRVKTNDYF